MTKLPNAYGAILPEKCLVVRPGGGKGGRIAMVFRFEMGYHDYSPSQLFKLDSSGATDQELWEACYEMNKSALGATPAQAQAMLSGSMFGWHVPAANPAMYDEKGRPK